MTKFRWDCHFIGCLLFKPLFTCCLLSRQIAPKTFSVPFPIPTAKRAKNAILAVFLFCAIFRLPARTEMRQDTTDPLAFYNALIFGAEHDRYQNQAVVQQRIGFSRPRR